MPKTKTKSQNHVFVCPINGVSFAGSKKREFRVDRVTFIDTNKFKRIRARLGFTKPFSDLKGHWWNEILEAPAVAYLFANSDPKKDRAACLRLVQKEIDLLALSQLGYAKRRYGAHPRIVGRRSGGAVSTAFIENGGNNAHFSASRRVSDIDSMRLNEEWRDYHKRFGFYFVFLKILRRENNDIRDSWIKTLTRAGVLIGQSQCSDDVADAFLKNMIAFEMLLTQQGDKYTDELPKRVDALLGWMFKDNREQFLKAITDIYKKRCKYVHDGQTDDITVADLLFTDDLLSNVLLNLVKHPQLFSSKKDVIDFSKKIAAEKLLGIKPRVRPKTFRFIRRTYTAKDLESI